MRWRSALAAAIRLAGVSLAGPISTLSCTTCPKVAKAISNFSRLPLWLNDSRSTRSSQSCGVPAASFSGLGRVRATSCDCKASSRTKATIASASTNCCTAACHTSPSGVGTNSAGAMAEFSPARSVRCSVRALGSDCSRTGIATNLGAALAINTPATGEFASFSGVLTGSAGFSCRSG